MNAIKRQRESSGLKQIDLSSLLNVSQSTVAMWETGEAMPRADKLPKLAEILGCTIDDLFRKEEREVKGNV